MGGDGVGVGSGGEQPAGVGTQVDVPREGSANRLNLNDLEFSAFGICPVDRDAVVTPVGGIGKAPIRVNQDLGRGIKGLAFLVLLTEGGFCGERLGGSFSCVPFEGGSPRASVRSADK